MNKGQRIEVAIGLGANLGEAVANILEAVRQLEARGLADIRLSGFYLTAPEECVPGTPDFVNGAVAGVWAGSAESLLSACQEIEERLGRPAEHARDEARMIDLDLLLAQGLRLDEKGLRLPHPRLTERLFVLFPLSEIVGEWRVAVGGRELTVAEWARELAERTPDLAQKIRVLEKKNSPA